MADEGCERVPNSARVQPHHLQRAPQDRRCDAVRKQKRTAVSSPPFAFADGRLNPSSAGKALIYIARGWKFDLAIGHLLSRSAETRLG
jgi:hypothetical protein